MIERLLVELAVPVGAYVNMLLVVPKTGAVCKAAPKKPTMAPTPKIRPRNRVLPTSTGSGASSHDEGIVADGEEEAMPPPTKKQVERTSVFLKAEAAIRNRRGEGSVEVEGRKRNLYHRLAERKAAFGW